MKSELTIGQVLKPRGLKGEMKFEAFVSSASQLAKLKNVRIDDTQYTVEHLTLDGVFGYIKLSGVDSAESAELLRGKEMNAPREQLSKLPNGKHYIVDLIGLDVYVGGECIGQVIEIGQYGSADVYTVRAQGHTISFAAIPGLIKSVDLDDGKIVLDDIIFPRVSVTN